MAGGTYILPSAINTLDLVPHERNRSQGSGGIVFSLVSIPNQFTGKELFTARLTTTLNIALDGSLLMCDGVSIAEGDLILPTGQTDAKENGLYLASLIGAWTRYGSIYPGALISVLEGSKLKDTEWMINSDSINIGVTDILVSRPNLSSKENEFNQFFEVKPSLSSSDKFLIEDAIGSPVYIKKSVDYSTILNQIATYILSTLPVDLDEKVKCSVNDTTANYLFGKLVNGDYTTLSIVNPGGNESIKIESEDQRVKATGQDSTSGTLDETLTTSIGIGKTVVGAAYSDQQLDVHLDNFAGLTGLNLLSLDSIPVQESTSNAIRKITPEMLRQLAGKNTTWDGDSSVYYINDPLPALTINITHAWINDATDDNKDLYLEIQGYDVIGTVPYTDQRALGVLWSIGGTDTVTWTHPRNAGRKITISAKRGQWFDIVSKDLYNPPANSKGILCTINPDATYTGRLYKIQKAVFVSKRTDDGTDIYWKLESYERIQTWFKRYPLTMISYPTPYMWTITDLPFAGYYKIDVFMEGRQVRTSTICSPRTLFCPLGRMDAKGSGDGILYEIDNDSKFNSCFGVGVSPDYDADVKGESLQGSCIVYVTGNNCTDRTITILVTKYNPTPQTTVSGYMGVLEELQSYCHVTYLGEVLGHDCYQEDI